MNYLKEIHESNLYGIVIEAGCSAANAAALMDVSGSSKTVFRAEQPYSKEYQEMLYGPFKRSVSREFIKTVLETEANKFANFTKINFVLATSWQLMDPNEPLVYAHGWIGLFDMQRNVKHYLHFTFNRTEFHHYRHLFNPQDKENFDNKDPYTKETLDQGDRKKLLNDIGWLATDVLHTAIKGNINDIKQVHSSFAILDMAYINDEVNYDLLVSTLEKANGDYFLVFKNNSVIRIEDLMREGDAFTIQKGSFNPLHHGHTKMMDESVSKHSSIPAFLISTYRYDKPHINYDELKERINMINKAGYPLIICKSVTFYETFNLLRTWSYGKGFYFPVGSDTINRIYKTDLDYVTNWHTNHPNTCYDAKFKNLSGKEYTVEDYIKDTVTKYKGNFKFLVFDRIGFTKAEEVKQYNDMVEYLEREDDGISSTKIREGVMKNKLEL